MEKDSYEVCQESLAQTSDCIVSHKCLTDPKNIVCKAEYFLAQQELFVKEKPGRHCNRYLAYGISGICRCPVRVELYKRYGI